MSSGATGSRGERISLALLALGMLASLAWSVHPWYDPTNDGAMYVLTGRAIAEGAGYSMLGQPFTIRPPGFSFLIAPILAWAGDDPFFALNLFVSLFGVLGCVLLYFWARERVGRALAWCLAAALWANPGYQLLCNQPMSDVPGLALLLACLLLERAADRRASWRRDLVLGLAIGAFAYVRSQIVLLAPAILAMRVVRRFLPVRRPSSDEPRESAESPESVRRWASRLGVLLATVALCQVPWTMRNSAVAPPPPADQTRLYSYSSGMFHEDMGDPSSRRLSTGEILGRIPQRGGQMLSVLASRMSGHPSPSYVGVGLLACVLVVLVRRRESAELFVLGSSALVSIYFGFAARLLLPIYALALPAAVLVVRDLVRWCGRRAGLAYDGGARAGSLVAGLALASLIVHDFDPRQGWRDIEHEHRQLEEIVRRFDARVAPDAVLASHRPWHYAVLMRRPIYSLEFAIRRAGGRVAAAEPLIDKYGIDTVILSPVRVLHPEVLQYFDARYGPVQGSLARVYRVR